MRVLGEALTSQQSALLIPTKFVQWPTWLSLPKRTPPRAKAGFASPVSLPALAEAAALSSRPMSQPWLTTPGTKRQKRRSGKIQPCRFSLLWVDLRRLISRRDGDGNNSDDRK